ncbi:hypothetical protein AGABI2DRAFT_180743 [Agaricus bisporus var. bisporus H97]|uniref:hypothetical protein n=1 Tax=Agaricus bisporus var. bisporus (strain H97 / ATCC MYA-4626 / FGSC 10389) TaxID=936046 RepID=UPI00029F5368|nr:hypothetical protein AGABI2DRAFT_180743 [Agaricus bisporus var. bisporus H97]EKV43672.1 hypothetical protein AGABI2DRAFT_180743 [Agaricus bisporus var. bisporus H97]
MFLPSTIPLPTTLDDEVNNTLGAAFFCFVCGCVLYGITLSQVYQYHRTYPEDAWYLKATPTRLSPFRVFDTHDVVLASQRDRSGHYNGSSDMAVGDVYHHDTVSNTTVQQIFVIIGGCLALAAVIVFLIELHRMEYLLDFASGAKWVLYFAFAVTCVVDIGVTVGMCTILTKSRIRVKGVQVATNAVLSKIIIFFISSGLLTTLVSIVYMVLYSSLPDVLLFVGATFSSSKLYANSALAMLNGRRHLRSQLAPSCENELPTSALHFRSGETSVSSPSTSDSNGEKTTPGRFRALSNAP